METDKLNGGIRFLCLAGIIQSAKYISAAVYMSGGSSMSRDLFENGLRYIGPGPDIMSAVAGLFGLVLIALSVKEDIDRRKGK